MPISKHLISVLGHQRFERKHSDSLFRRRRKRFAIFATGGERCPKPITKAIVTKIAPVKNASFRLVCGNVKAPLLLSSLCFLSALGNRRVAHPRRCKGLTKLTLAPCFTSHSPSSCKCGRHCRYCSWIFGDTLERRMWPASPQSITTLCDVDARAGDVRAIVYIHNPAHRTAMNAHANFQF